MGTVAVRAPHKFALALGIKMKLATGILGVLVSFLLFAYLVNRWLNFEARHGREATKRQAGKVFFIAFAVAVAMALIGILTRS